MRTYSEYCHKLNKKRDETNLPPPLATPISFVVRNTNSIRLSPPHSPPRHPDSFRGTKHYTEKTIFPFPFTVNEIWLRWQFLNQMEFPFGSKTVITIISHPLCKEMEIQFSQCSETIYPVNSFLPSQSNLPTSDSNIMRCPSLKLLCHCCDMVSRSFSSILEPVDNIAALLHRI